MHRTAVVARVRRVALGLSTAVACATCATPDESTRPVIGFVQVASVAPLDEAREGFFQALADSGYVRDVDVTILDRNAQGDIPTLSLIIAEFAQQGVTHVATVSSVATQAALKSITDRPVIFGAVANPYIIGAGTSPANHRPNVTGAEIPLPVDSALAAAIQVFPEKKVWGTLFDPADPFAEFYLEQTRRAARELGVRLLSVAATQATDIPSGVQALRAQGAEGVMQIPSVMIGGGFPALVKTAREAGMPVIASTTGYAGAVLSLGLSFYDNGYDMGLILMRVIKGEDPAKIPFQAASKRILVIDLDAAAAVGATIPPAMLARADSIIGGGAATEATAASVSAANAANPGGQRGSNWAFWLSAIAQGLAYVALAWGVFLSARVLRFPDITPDGTFPLGAAVAAAMILAGAHPVLATLVAILAGMAAGYITGVLHTRFAVTELLAGILVMTALYSVNLHVMGRSNLSLLDADNVVVRFRGMVPASTAWPDDVAFAVVFLSMMALMGAALFWYLRTDFGIAMRAAGDNPAMITAQGVDRRGMVELGLALSNGCVAFAGALIAQYQSFADVGMGVGTLVAGMAAVILGETLSGRKWGLGARLVMIALGAIMFRSLIALALRVGLNPIDLKLATAVFVLGALVLPQLTRRGRRR